jgi:DNA-binding IclR family transcriptional regulator
MTISQNISLINGLEILLLYSTDELTLSVKDISKKLRFSQSKTYRLVETLTKHDFLQKKPGTKQYALGLNSVRLGLIANKNFGLHSVARPFMDELCRLSKETVFLSVIKGTKRVLLEKVESDEPIRFSPVQIGKPRPLTVGASSKLLLAYLPKEDWDRIINTEELKRYTPYTITDPNKLKKELMKIRENGYSYSDREEIPDVRGVAAPIRNTSGKIIGALSIGGPVYRIDVKKLKMLIKWVVDYSDRISTNDLLDLVPL